jgi:hypothetical protein
VSFDPTRVPVTRDLSWIDPTPCEYSELCLWQKVLPSDTIFRSLSDEATMIWEITFSTAGIWETLSSATAGQPKTRIIILWFVITFIFSCNCTCFLDRARDYCTSGRHVVSMCINVIKVSVYIQVRIGALLTFIFAIYHVVNFEIIFISGLNLCTVIVLLSLFQCSR